MRPYLRHTEAIVLALILLSAPAALGANDWPVPRGPSREPVPYRYDAGQWKDVPRDFLDDAPACILYAGINYILEPDGTIETITHEVTRLNSRKAVQDLGEYRAISFSPGYEKLTLNEARVVKPDGRSIPVEPKHVQLRDSVTDYQVYDPSKQLVVSYPSLEVGDVIEVKWSTRGKNPEHQGQFFTRYTFGSDSYPIVTDEMRIRLPRERTLKYQATGGTLDPTITEEGDTRLFHWRATHRPQLPTDENLPSKEDLRLQVSCSTFGSWEAIHKWKQHLRRDCWTCTPEIRRVVAEVTKDLQTPREKARALTYWVRRHVRYVSVGERHDYTPHQPGTVLNNRFGDCKDTTQLLAVMLKEAGIQVALASLGVRGDGQVLEAVPSPWGTHAILLVTIDGQEHWIDTTSSLAGWDQLPRDDRNRLCYVTDDNGLRLVRTPALTPADRRIEQETTITIGPDGSTRWERTVGFHGLAALSRRNDWVEVPVGERRRNVTAELQDSQSKSRLCTFELDEARLKNYDEPVQARVVFEVIEQFAEDAEQPGHREASFTDSPVWHNLLWYNLSYDRTQPLELESPFESRHRYVLHLPPYFTLDSKLADRTVHSKWGFFHLKVKLDDDNPRRIELEYHTRIDRMRVEPDEFDAFRKFHERVAKSYRVWMTLRPANTLADTPLLEALLRLTPGDAAAARLLAQLYLANSQHAEARRVLLRARYFQPENTQLAELAVKAAATLPEEEAIYRDLIRHNPTELKYTVALARNLVSQHRLADARAALRPVLTKGNAVQQSQAHYELARIALLDNKPANALAHFDAAQKADWDTVNTVAALRFKAGVLEKLNKPRDAAEAYREALDIDPAVPEALEALVRLELAADNRSRALDYLRRYTVAVARDGTALARAADYHLRMDRTEDAFELASRARDLVEGNALAQRTLGLVYLRRANYARAAFHLERADLDSTVLSALIRSRLALGQLSLAVQDADQAEKVEKPSPELVEICQATLILVQRRKAVLAEQKPPADQLDRWTEATDRLVCAEYLWKADRPAAEVQSLLAGAIVPDVELGPAYGLRGALALERGRLLKALDDAEKAVKRSPAEPIGHYVRGRVRLERGQAEALADLQKAAELCQRKDARILHWLAAALWREGQKDEARKTQREAAQLKPADTELMDQLREFDS
jgi:tetratricopeptide (TPR) repeat protein/transglutaminase-like putative cysteine protease